MARMSVLISVIVLALLVCPLQAQPPAGVNLAAMQTWDIVIAKDAIPSEIYAAEEFQELFRQASGAKLPIVRKINRLDRHVFIGPSRAMRSSNVGFSIDEFGEEDLRIVVRDSNVAIAGGRTRGALYGVYKFLEDYLGIRFLTKDFTHVPKIKDDQTVGPIDIRFNPPFPHYRECSLAVLPKYPGSSLAGDVFSVRQRNKYYRHWGDPKYGGPQKYHIINHSFLKQIPLEKYGKTHPEYYCMWDGKRSVHLHSHYCLTNPELLPIVTDAVLKHIKEHEESKSGNKNFSVSQNDTVWQYCQCDKCQALAKAEGTNMAPLLKFVNAVAAQVAEKHPDVLVGTLAYGFSRTPPKTIKPLPNVQINLCTMTACHIHAIGDANCPENVKFKKELEGWSKVCKHLSIWDYSLFCDELLPFPNLRALEKNIRAYRDAGAEGIFLQMNSDPQDLHEFSALRRYVMSSLMWTPDRNGSELIDEFCNILWCRRPADTKMD